MIMRFSGLNNSIRRIEELVLSLLLSTMILLSCLQIFLRQFFDSGLPWADPLLRHLVVWGGLLGAVLAVSQGKHISLDILSNLLPGHTKKFVSIASQLFSSIVCGFLTYASLLFLQNEMEFGGGPFLTIPSWGWNLIFPLAFAAMSLRYAVAIVTSMFQLDSQQSKSKAKTR